MNNNGMNFDPNTGKPITQVPSNNEGNNAAATNNNIGSNGNVNVSPNIQPTSNINQPLNSVNNIQQQNLNQIQNTQNTIANQVNQMQSIPTVDQDKQSFINNTQSISLEKKEEKKSGINYTFIVILFILIFVAIFFLFPFLQKNL